jgi:poly(A) polymerase
MPELAENILEKLTTNGYVALLAGGCVRDAILGITPKDFDVATNATPDQVQALFPDSVLVGARFGVVVIRKQDGEQVEVATFRTDGCYSDNRRPDQVQFSTPEEDANRRDFTMNALFWSPVRPSGDLFKNATMAPQTMVFYPEQSNYPRAGYVIDFVGGLDDIRANVIRAVGSAKDRFSEDRLRVLRCVRFASRLDDFILHSSTAQSIRDLNGDLSGVSRERIGYEVRRIFSDRYSANRGMELFNQLALTKSIFGLNNFDCTFPRCQFEDRFVSPATANMAVWLARNKATSDDINTIAKSLVLSNEEKRDLRDFCNLCDALRNLDPLSSLASRIRLAQNAFFDGAVSVVCNSDDTTNLSTINTLLDQTLEANIRMGTLTPVPLMNGKLLNDLRIINAGPDFKRVLDSIYDAQLEGLVTSTNQAVEMAKELANKE